MITETGELLHRFKVSDTVEVIDPYLVSFCRRRGYSTVGKVAKVNDSFFKPVVAGYDVELPLVTLPLWCCDYDLEAVE